jgi:cytochrome c-type biogenesis protein CcsB
MNSLIFTIIVFYILSAACYLLYFFHQKNRMNLAGFLLLVCGVCVHTILIASGFISNGYLPVYNLRETLSIAGWALSVLFVAFQFKYKLKILGVFAAPLCALIMVIVSQLSNTPVEMKKILESYWLLIHIISVFLGDAAFALACGLGIIYLVQERTIKNKNHGFFFKRLPSLGLIDTTNYACIVIGFTLLTIGLLSGVVYAKTIWGRFWGWDPKEVWSAVTWLLYAALLHGRISLGWRGRKAAIMSIVGFVVLMFTFLGVNFLLKGHHGVFTKI